MKHRLLKLQSCFSFFIAMGARLPPPLPSPVQVAERRRVGPQKIVHAAEPFLTIKQGGPDVNNILNKLGLDSVNPETATVAANLGIAYVFYKVRGTGQEQQRNVQSPGSRHCRCQMCGDVWRCAAAVSAITHRGSLHQCLIPRLPLLQALTPVRMPIGIALVPLIAKMTGTKAAEVSESTGQE
jgi:hypothetical protein